MPSYLDFESTKRFRDFVIAKTIKNDEEGPQTYTADSYSVSSIRQSANIDQPDVDENRTNDLSTPQRLNTYKPQEYFIIDNVETLQRSSNLELYPFFDTNRDYNLIGIMSGQQYDDESELFKFASTFIRENEDGPVFARIQQNLQAATIGRARILDALDGNVATASNIITGREPLVESNYKITVAKTLPGKSIDFLQTVAGVEFPFSEIPGDYLTDPANPINVRPTQNSELGRLLQDTTGVLGSLLGINRRPTPSRKPSDLLIEYMGSGQKNLLFDQLSYSKYAPNYTTTARSQNTSKLFNFVDNVAQGVKNFLGTEAPRKQAYIGDDRGEDVKFAMNDFNERQVKSPYYLSIFFDPELQKIYNRKNISEGGNLSGNLTWISKNSQNQLGIHNEEWGNQQTDFNESVSTNYGFREDSILGETQKILDTLPINGGEARSHVANAIDQTSRIFREGDRLFSRGSAIKYVDRFGEETGAEYCRVWTKDRSYLNYSDTMKRTGTIRKFDDSVLTNPWNLNIAPMRGGNRDFDGSSNIEPRDDGFYAKKYMFSIENLAWASSNTKGFTYNDLPFCERGPNRGRVMWFPPYELKVTEQSSAKWESNTFIGRPEPIYTYQNTERNGQISFKVIVDHPSVLNLLVNEHFKNFTDDEAENYIDAFFAGCEELDFYDLITRYQNITPSEAQILKDRLENGKKSDEETIKNFRRQFPDPVDDEPNTEPEPSTKTVSLDVSLNFKNDDPNPRSTSLKSTKTYTQAYSDSIGDDGFTGRTYDNLSTILDEILTGVTTYNTANAINDKKVLFPDIDPLDTSNTNELKNIVLSDLESIIEDSRNNYTQYESGINTLKTDIENGEVNEVKLRLLSSTSAVADDSYNYRLSIRRSHSLVKDVLERLSSGVEPRDKWSETVTGLPTSATDITIEYTFKELGYETEGKIIFETTSEGEEYEFKEDNICGQQNFQYVASNGATLKISSPLAYGCRQSTLKLKYNKITQQEPQDPETPQSRILTQTDDGLTNPNIPQRPPLESLKKIVMKTLSECYYFKQLEDKDPFVFSKMKEKLKYFHPSFHSTTPEGLNSRLTFLQQCLRPGDTIPIKGVNDVTNINARNTSFGPPPICVIRVGDFFHSKIIIRDLNITYDNDIWDLNPEGIGIQPMIATIQLQVSFIGGQGLKEPVSRLQNALSSNFYANTEMYDPRSISTIESINGDDPETFSKEFLEKIQKKQSEVVDSLNNNDGNNLIKGDYIGNVTNFSDVLNKNPLVNYTELVNDVFNQTKNYFETYVSAYNLTLLKFGDILSTLYLHPDYRVINDYGVFNTVSSTPSTTLDLFGLYSNSKPLSLYINNLKNVMNDKLNSVTSISTILGLDKVLNSSLLEVSDDNITTVIRRIQTNLIESFSVNTQIRKLNDVTKNLVSTLDKVNFLVKYGYDVKIEGETVTKATLSGFTSSDFYKEYSDCINFINQNKNRLYDDLDTSSVDFNSITFSDDVYGEILSVILRNNKETLMNVYRSNPVFTNSEVSKISDRLDRFFTTPKTLNVRFLNRLPNRSSSTELSYTISSTEEVSDNNVITETNKLFAITQNPEGIKLNYYK